MKTPSIAQIQERSCEVFGISTIELLSEKRTERIAIPRLMMMQWCKQLGYRTDLIAESFKRDRRSVDHAVNSQHFNKLELERMEQVKALFNGKESHGA